MPLKAISRLTGEHDTRIWRVVGHWVDRSLAGLDLSSLAEVGLDETSSAKGHRYVTVFLDLDPAGRRVVYACPGKDAETVASFSEELKERGGDPSSIKRFCCDMSPAYAAGIRESFPQAEIIFDRFHLKQAVSRAVDETRRAEGKERKELRGTRYLWLKRPENLKERQRQKLDVLLSSGLKTARAYQLSLSFDAFFEVEEELAEEYLYRWFWRATHSRLEPMRRVAHTIRNHWEGVLSWHRHKVSTGVLEAINGLIQAAKRRARGYRNIRYLITMIYLIAGKLDFEGLPLPVLCATHSK
jgi:transposase